MTPASTAKLMAAMMLARGERIRLLDAGAGVGSLTAAWVAEVCGRKRRPSHVELVAYELDPDLAKRLRQTLESCREACSSVGISCAIDLRTEDFIEAGVRRLRGGFFGPPLGQFDCAILNPPYRKVHSQSREKLLLQQLGVETSNLYAAFISLVLKLLAPGGEVVAISPRSFCNGPYFRSFRQLLLSTVSLRRIHVFDSRATAFRDDNVLQENIIFHGVVDSRHPKSVFISSSASPTDLHATHRRVAYEAVVPPHEPQSFIHLVIDDVQEHVATRMAMLATTLNDLDLAVSTGRVVDFRATKFLRSHPAADTVPLIYPAHFEDGYVRWPRDTRKPAALARLEAAEDLLVPSETYVLVKRFSAKEERRRVVAALYDPTRLDTDSVGFENHLNYFHRGGRGLPRILARGLTVFLNSHSG